MPLKKRIATEHEEALALLAWTKYIPEIKDIIIHIPNEGKRTYATGRKLKLIGLRSGVSDFLVPLPRKSHHGLWIELKRVKYYYCRASQREWIEKMRELGYAAHFAYGWEHAKSIIEDYLS